VKVDSVGGVLIEPVIASPAEKTLESVRDIRWIYKGSTDAHAPS
jgi:hypothetical protein